MPPVIKTVHAQNVFQDLQMPLHAMVANKRIPNLTLPPCSVNRSAISHKFSIDSLNPVEILYQTATSRLPPTMSLVATIVTEDMV